MSTRRALHIDPIALSLVAAIVLLGTRRRLRTVTN